MEELSFIWSHKSFVLAIILSLVIAGGCLYIKILKEELNTAVAQKAVIASDLALSQSSVKDLQASIVTQNAAVDKLKSDNDARVASHQVELNAARQTAQTYKQQAQSLMKLVADPTIAQCVAVNNLINSQLPGAKK